MKMLVFYRSREYSNAIICSTKSKLENNSKAKGLDVDFINLDKRNYVKVLSQMEDLPQFIFIWYDEEKISDYINENYPSIEVIHFSPQNAVSKTYNNWYNYAAKEYKLIDLMLDKFKSSLKKKTIYQVDNYYNLIISEMDDMDIAMSGFPHFETKDEANKYRINKINDEILKLESKIEDYKKSIKDCRAELRKKKVLLNNCTI